MPSTPTIISHPNPITFSPRVFGTASCPTNPYPPFLLPPPPPPPPAEFLAEDMELLQAKGHEVERVDVLSLVEGTRRTNDLIIGVKDPRSADALALTMSMTMP